MSAIEFLDEFYELLDKYDVIIDVDYVKSEIDININSTGDVFSLIEIDKNIISNIYEALVIEHNNQG